MMVRVAREDPLLDQLEDVTALHFGVLGGENFLELEKEALPTESLRRTAVECTASPDLADESINFHRFIIRGEGPLGVHDFYTNTRHRIL